MAARRITRSLDPSLGLQFVALGQRPTTPEGTKMLGGNGGAKRRPEGGGGRGGPRALRACFRPSEMEPPDDALLLCVWDERPFR